MTNAGKKNPYYGKTGKDHPTWKGGRWLTCGYDGSDRWKYINVYVTDHPHAVHPKGSKGGYVLEHRLVMEKKLGRYLKPEEVVHHINDNPRDNRPENLMLFPNHGTHSSYECKRNPMPRDNVTGRFIKRGKR